LQRRLDHRDWLARKVDGDVCQVRKHKEHNLAGGDTALVRGWRCLRSNECGFIA
jgi:hypothetical protein